ncbi:MAG: hypothetical protein QXO51_00675 [Halobacteria archaeon]
MKGSLLVLIAAALLVAGCTQSPAPAATPSPTSPPLAGPTGPATAPPVPASLSPAPTPAAPPLPASPPSQPAPTSVPTPTSLPKLSIEWTRDSGTRVADGSVPFGWRLADGRTRLYYCGKGGIRSAISSNGLDFADEPGTRMAPDPSSTYERVVCDPTLVALEDGRVRMYYKGGDGKEGGPGTAVHKVFSAVSSDGLTFTKEGLRIDPDKTGDRGWASVPEAIKLPDGRVRIYYVTGDLENNNGIASAISNDGLTFTKEPGARVRNLVDPALLLLPDGRFLLLAANPGAYRDIPAGIYAYTSQDGLTFGDRQTVLQQSMVFDPTVLQLDGSTLRVFFGAQSGQGGPGQMPSMSTQSATGKVK